MKKILALILAMCLLCMMAVGTTLTYFTDEDGDVNTMVVGKVEIEQIEQKHDENGALVNSAANADGITSLGRLYPYTGGAAVDGWFSTANNAVDKIVTVKNTGSEAAYVRTIFAFEMMAIKDANDQITGWNNPFDNADGKVEIRLNGAVTMTDVTFKKGNVQYVVGYCTYEDALAKNATTAPSLKQFYLDSSVGNAFADAIGGSYEILVISQAVQTQGFTAEGSKTVAQTALDKAFGEINAANAAKWFD